VDTIYVVVKATFDIGDGLRISEIQVPPVAADEYWGDPTDSSLKYCSEVHLEKPATDIALVGQAWAPEGKRATQLDVSVTVADRKKTVRVFGDRRWHIGMLTTSVTKPEPFESVPIVYERAYGGRHIEAEKQIELAEERNPVGCGFRGKRNLLDAVGQSVPNVEDPDKPITKYGAKAPPAGFGFIAPHWLPRREFAGTYDEQWEKSRAPYLPEDFQSRFFNAAHTDLTGSRHLEGGEPVRVVNASPRGTIQFTLPECRILAEVRVAGRVESPRMNLETVLIEPDDDRLCLTWRGSVLVDKVALQVESIHLSLERLESDGESMP
jgi:hypothetical protein